MTLELYDNETQKYIIEKDEPEKPQWWITGFNPKEKRYGKFDPSVLTATFEVDFETKDKFEAFMKNKLDYENRTGCCIFDKPDTYVVQIVW